MNKNKISSRIFTVLIALVMIFSLVNNTPIDAAAIDQEISDTENLEELEVIEDSILEIPIEKDLLVEDPIEVDLVEEEPTEDVPIVVEENDEEIVIPEEEISEVSPEVEDIIVEIPDSAEKEEDSLDKEDDEIVEVKNWDNPDNLDGPSDSSHAREIVYNAYPETNFPSTSKSASKTSSSSPVIGTDHPSQPGEVMLFKEVESVPGRVNTWDITLRVEGKNKPTTSDIILVIDNSGSMGDYGRMAAARAAANSFIDNLLPSTTTRIGLVSFAEQAYILQNLTNNATRLKDEVDDLRSNGGTFTQAAIKQAQAMLANSNANFKHIVVLSDGVPTYSYQLNNPDNYLIAYGSNSRQTSSLAPSNAYTNNRGGDGMDMWYHYGMGGSRPNRYNKYYNHGHSAMAQAGYAKASGYRIWGIGLSVNDTGRSILNGISSPNSYYDSTPQNLTTVFNQIAGQIASAIKDAHVTDPMGVGFDIPGGASDITYSQGSLTYSGSTISWDPGAFLTPISTGSDVYYAQISYRIEITDDILGETPDSNGEYPTNGNAKISFIDFNGNPQTKYFPIPKVNPVFYSVEKVLLDENGQVTSLDEDFNIDIKGPLASGLGPVFRAFSFNGLTNMVSGLQTDLRLAGDYTFIETGDLSGYEVKFYINGLETSDRIFQIVDDYTDDVHLKVVNKVKPAKKLIVKKEITGNYGDLDKEFEFNVYKSGILHENFFLKHDGPAKEIGFKANDQIAIEELNPGDYGVRVLVNGVEILPDVNGKYHINLLDYSQAEINILVKNHKDIEIDTGIRDDNNTIYYALVISVIAVATIILRKRKLDK